MSEEFKIGEIAIGQNATRLPQYNGQECVILESLSLRRWRPSPFAHSREDYIYLVRWQDGARTAAFPYQLRRKEPPHERQAVGSWAECPWKPAEISVGPTIA